MGGISIDYNSLAVNVNKKRFPSKLSRMVDVCNFNMRTLMNNWPRRDTEGEQNRGDDLANGEKHKGGIDEKSILLLYELLSFRALENDGVRSFCQIGLNRHD